MWYNTRVKGVKMSKNFPSTLRRFYFYVIKKFPFYFGTILILGCIQETIGMIVSPLLLKWTTGVFENAVAADWNSAMHLIIFLAFFYFFPQVIMVISDILRAKYQQYFNRYKLYLLYKRVYENDVSFFINHPSGQITSHVSEVSGDLNLLMEKFWVIMAGTLLGFFFIIGSLFAMNVWFVVILLGFGVFKVIWVLSWQKKVKKNNEKRVDEIAAYNGIRSDSLANAVVVKWFANTEYENTYIYKGRDKLIDIEKKKYYLSMSQNLINDVLWNILRLVFIVMCFFMIRQGSLSVAGAVFVITSAQSINGAFSRINYRLTEYSQTLARAKKAFANIIVEQKVLDKDDAKKLSVKEAEISFENIWFGYGEEAVLKNFTFEIKKHERVGIVGLSGAGKTTLVNLLLRMYDVDAGAIKINGIDIRDVTQDSLRRNISLVPQDISLFNRSLLENIRYAKPHATKQTVIAAAKKANIHDFISKLKNGYATLVGNNGIRLSGGQRQRVSIARALVKDAPILILDEATSALDSKNEIEIQKSLEYAMRGKTTIAIAHRISTLRNMDRIIVMKNGRIIEEGNHNQLVRRGGIYHNLWRMQTGAKKKNRRKK